MIVGYCSAGAFQSAGSLAAQQRNLATAGAEKFFCERVGMFGKSPELERAIEFAQKGDVIVVTASYRIARTSRGVLSLIQRLGRKGVGLRILGSPIDSSTTTGRMILGSAPLWSLGISPLRSVLRDLSIGRRQSR
jgi:DNA invertase Pin-like site-specific DNA recombinase